MRKLALAMLFFVLPAGCGGSLRGDAGAGPNPDGGFYGAPNINVGRIKPLARRVTAAGRFYQDACEIL
jgi:hypothetical protein